jgi:hypothetical protein
MYGNLCGKEDLELFPFLVPSEERGIGIAYVGNHVYVLQNFLDQIFIGERERYDNEVRTTLLLRSNQ